MCAGGACEWKRVMVRVAGIVTPSEVDGLGDEGRGGKGRVHNR